MEGLFLENMKQQGGKENLERDREQLWDRYLHISNLGIGKDLLNQAFPCLVPVFIKDPGWAMDI